MKNIFNFMVLLVVTIFICASVTNAQWFTQSPLPTGNNLNAVFFTDANIGTAVGTNGTIVRTTDAGATWINQSQTVEWPDWLFGVYFTDANNGTAVGSDFDLTMGIILKTTDGGNNWVRQTNGTTTQLKGVFFTDANTGTAVGFGGTILRTTDGGSTWTTQISGITNNLFAVFFTDANTGTVVGAAGKILRTTDGGTSWVSQTSGVTIALRAVYFTDANTGTVVGATGNIRRTTDGGTTWTGQTSGTTALLAGISFTDSNTGIAVGAGTILRTTDAGVTWTFQPSGTSNLLNGVSFTDVNTGTVVGNIGTVLRTTDGGVTWTILSSGVASSLYGVSFTNANIGTVVGVSGTIARTTDGGTTWIYQTSGTTNQLNEVFFTDANMGTAVGAFGTILRTTNGGSTWTSQTSGTTEDLNGVYFIDAMIGTAVGRLGTILRTTDGGSNWIPQTSGTTFPLLAVFFTDANTGSVVGFVGVILRTTDGGNTWAYSQGTGANTLNDVFFTNTDTGIAVGVSGKIFRTTDGGNTWTAQTSGTTRELYGVTFTDANTGTVVGALGTILRTPDGGTTWISQTSGTTNQLNEVCFTDAMTGTAVGFNGTILRTTNGGTILPSDPTGVSATTIDYQQIDIAFTPNGASNNVVMVWNTTGTFDLPSGTPPTTLNDPFAGGFFLSNGITSPVSHTGLNSGTIYYYKVFSYDGVNYSPGIAVNATTLCPVVVAPFTEDFESATFPPACWTLSTTGSDNWDRSTSASGYGIGTASATADFYDIAAGASFDLTTFEFDASGMTSPRLKFDWAYSIFPGSVDTLKISCSTDAGTSWVVLAAMYADAPGSLNLNPYNLSNTSEYGVTVPVANGDWSTITFGIPSTTNKVKFTAVSDFGNNLFVDNIKVEEAPSNDIGVVQLAMDYGTLTEHIVQSGLSREAVESYRIKSRSFSIKNVSIKILTTQNNNYSPDAAVNFLAVIENFGSSIESSYQVGWEIDGTLQTSVSNIEPLEVGDTDTLTLTWVSATEGFHFARAWSILATDTNPNNDSSGVISFYVAPDNSIFIERFEGTFPPTGWIDIDADGSGFSWFQGNPVVWAALEGTPSSYAASNYEGANLSNVIDQWLVTPNTGGLARNGTIDSLVFWLRVPYQSIWIDTLEIRVSTTGQNTTDFNIVLDVIAGDISVDGWSRYAYPLPDATNRYIAFRHHHLDAINASNYIGLDLVQVLRYTSTTTFSFSIDVYPNKWNMVSAPGLHPTDQNVGTWWPDLTGTVWGFNGTVYTVTTTATPGEGYWMKHAGVQTSYSYTDIQIVSHAPIPGHQNWNIIGVYEDPAAESGIDTDPTGQRTGTIWGFDGTVYVNMTGGTLQPGYGYWIKLLSVCDIIIPEPPLSKVSGEVADYFKSDWGRIVMTDAAGISYTLYAVKGEVDLDQYEMPPAMPGGMFDIRFSSGRVAEDINSSVKTIDMQGITYPLTVRVEGMDMRLMDVTGKAINQNLKDGEDIVIGDATIQKLMVTGELIPDVYALEQNYPNPFNPSTVIEFSLPEDVSNVKLSIYNALGERVAELVNSSLTAGRYQYRWNAVNVATGMYIYELRTDKFVSVKKMMLLK